MDKVLPDDYYLNFIGRLSDQELKELVAFCLMQYDKKKYKDRVDELREYVPSKLQVQEDLKGERRDSIGRCIYMMAQLGSGVDENYFLNDYALRQAWSASGAIVYDDFLHQYLALKFDEEYIKHLHNKLTDDANKKFNELSDICLDGESIKLLIDLQSEVIIPKSY